MRLAKIPYLNSAPYFHFLSSRWLGQHRLVVATPRQLGDLARRNEVDAGLFSLVDCWDLVAGGDFEYVGDLGIAGWGAIGSILLCGVRDPRRLEGQAVAVSSHTATSARLLELWLREKVGVRHYTEVAPGAEAAAELLIGDEALRRHCQLSPADPPPIDLALAWKEWTGLPFVFARWAVRKDRSEAEKRELRLSLQSSLELAVEDIEALCQRKAEELGLDAEFIRAYLQGIVYRLGPQEEKGMALFRQKLATYNKVASTTPSGGLHDLSGCMGNASARRNDR